MQCIVEGNTPSSITLLPYLVFENSENTFYLTAEEEKKFTFSFQLAPLYLFIQVIFICTERKDWWSLRSRLDSFIPTQEWVTAAESHHTHANLTKQSFLPSAGPPPGPEITCQPYGPGEASALPPQVTPPTPPHTLKSMASQPSLKTSDPRNIKLEGMKRRVYQCLSVYLYVSPISLRSQTRVYTRVF